MKHSNNHIGRITIFSIIVAATLGIAMAGGLVRWQGITDLFKGDSPEKTAKVPATTTAKAPNNENYAHTTAFSGMPFMLSVEGCSITGEAGSMDGTSEIEIMAIDSVPPLAAGMVNVTRGHAGYRLSPAGLRFARPVSVELGYDSLLLPKGHSAKEIRTFLYNSEKRHWEALPRDSVMEGSQNIVSQSKQAGEMINAIVQLPELPESKAFTPTMLTELEAAHPATGITMMEPPAANSQGTANLSYPITVPAGRNGLQPNLSVSYSSEAGNGLLGMGWDMQLPAITVDSKWGVPRYDAADETECYSYNGQELLPSPHYLTQWESRNTSGNKQFRPRTEGSFDSIVRCGNGPTKYYWIVWDKGGTKYYYGTYDGSTVATSVLLMDGAGNIGHWPLCRVEDLDGNFMTYHYTVREQEDADGNKLGKQLWPDSIVYTGHRNGNTEERGRYRVVFSSGFHPRFRLMQALELNQSDPDGQTNGTDSTYQDLGDGCDIKIRVRKRDRRTGTLLSGAVFNLHNNTNDMCLTTNSIGEAVWRLETYDDYNLFLREETPPSGWCTRMQDISLHVVKVSGACHLDVSALDVHVDSVIYENTLGTEVRIVVTNDICGDEAYQCVDVCDCDSVWDDLEGEYPYDMRTDARLGFLRSSKEKMRRMVVYYRDSVVRSYSFCYGRDIFGRAQLRSIRQYGADCSEEPFTHTFSYYRDADSVRLKSGGQSVNGAGRGQDNMPLSSLTGRAGRLILPVEGVNLTTQSVLDATRQFSFGGGGGGYFGLGYDVWNHEPALTLDFDYSHSSGSGRATLADVTGDGLPDRVFVQSGQVYYKRQLPAGGFDTNCDSLRKFSAFLRDKGDQYSLTAGANAGAHGGLGGNYGTHRTTTYLADVNGDGLPDVVSSGGARAAVRVQPPFNMEFDGCGLPRITPSAGYYPEISMTSVPSVPEDEDSPFPSYDLVRVWRYNGDGLEASTGNAVYSAELTDVLVPGAAASTDTVIISVELYDTNIQTQSAQMTLLQSDMLTIMNPSVNRNLTCSLSYGDMLFFRARSLHGRQVSHLLRWNPRVFCADTVRDPNTLLFPDAETAGRCQLLQGDGLFVCPFAGTVSYEDNLDLNGFSDVPVCELWHNRTLKMSSSTSGVVSLSFNVSEGDTLKFLFRCGSNVDLAGHAWRPKIHYTYICYDTVVSTPPVLVQVDNPEAFMYWPLPGYEYWNGYIGDQSFVQDAGGYTVRLNSPSYASDSLTFVVKSGGNTVLSHLFTLASDVVSVQLQQGDCLECYVPEGKDAGKFKYNIPFEIRGPQGTADVGVRYRESAELLYGRFYGGWSQFQYRHDDIALMDMAKLGRLAAAAASTSGFSQEIDNLVGECNSNEGDTNKLHTVAETNNPLYNNVFVNKIFDCLPLTANGETRRHEGICPNSWIKGDTISLGCLPTAMQVTEEDARDTAYNPDEQVANGGGSASGQRSGTTFDTKATDKVSRTLGASASAGAWKVGANSSYSTTKTVRDFMDLNGDGVPDFIDKDNICYSLPCRSDGKVRWESGWRTVFGGKCSSRSYSFSTGAGYTAQKEELLEITRNSNKGGHTIVSGGSVSGNASTAWDHTVLAMVDMNGDGLPDKVDNRGNVCLNTGYGFMPPRQWNNLNRIGKRFSATGSANAGLNNVYNNASALKASYSGGVSLTVSVNSEEWTLADMNGDGLPDLVHRNTSGGITYQLNTGSFFEGRSRVWKQNSIADMLWGTSATISASLKATFGGSFFGCKVGGTPSLDGSVTHTNSRLQISDFDGDGIPDLLKSGGSDLEVRYAELGRTGLLKTVTTPLGGSITMDYAMTPANVHHSRRWVMTKVMTNDSLPGDGCDSTRTCVSYAYGYHDRAEREFLGFAKVTVSSLDGNGDTLGRSVRYYDNRSVHAKGSLLCEAVLGRVGQAYRTYHVTTCTYTTDSVGVRMGGTRAVFPKLTRRQTCHYDENGHPKITAWEEFAYENSYGNVILQRQGADRVWTGTPIQKTVVANISYHPQYNNNHCVNRVSSVEIPGYKKRTTEVDIKGHYTVFRDYYDNTHSLATRLQYDQYGNVTTMRGPNTTVHYTYDNYVHSYPTAITDTFGISSGLQNYDFRFGIPRTVVDQAGSRMLYTLDEWGRTVSIQGPKELAAQVPYTIRYNYTGREPAPSGSTHQRAVSMAMTEHYDPQHPSNPIKTYTYCDGLGRIVQTRKEAAVNGVEKLVVSGHAVIDALGRTVASYYSTETNLGDTVFAFVPDQSAPASTVTYDVLDRPLVQTAPDASTTTFQYGFDSTYNDTVLFSTITTDANNHSSTELKDAGGRPRAVQASGQPYVHFIYDHVGNNTNVRSSVADDWERTYTYDWLGRRLTYVEGELAESLTYDGGNLSTHTQSWSENGLPQSRTTHYHYNAHRLDSVGYDDALTTIYHYDQYGRVDSLYDESGVMCYEYGNMGEVTRETRIYALPFLTNALALSTQFTYDSWGRILNITYPDNEVVNYAYDLGGQLFRFCNNSNYSYLDSVKYDRFGAKTSQKYGNGLKTSYTYNNLTRRLSNIATMNGNSQVSYFAYTYDNVGNVTQVTSSCPWLTNQTFTESFTYDASDQLTTASETQNRSYTLSVSYDNWGKMENYDILYTDLLNSTTTQDNRTFSYPDANSLQDAQTLFAPEQCAGTTDVAFTFGINGSLRKREVSNPQPYTEYYLFNSAANMKAYSNNGLDVAYYGYNSSNSRTYKLSFLNTNQWVNGQPEPLDLQLQNAMFYPNAYLNFNHNGEYTKHYYNGAERIASRLGNTTSQVSVTANARLTSRSSQLDNRFQEDILDLMPEGVSVSSSGGVNVSSLESPTGTSDIYYYHTNHLGSTAFVTDQNQNVTQGFLYAPFGEITTEFNATFGNDIIPKYSFNAKELDEETGMYYYEARYYKPPVFTSRDPMFEKYFWMTPYAYCANNPVKYVDPSGEEAWKPDEEGNLIAEKGDNAWTFAQYLNTSPEIAKKMLNEQGYTVNNKGVLNLKVGDVFIVDYGNETKSSDNLGSTGNRIRDHATKGIAQDLFTSFWQEKGDVKLTGAQFAGILLFIKNNADAVTDKGEVTLYGKSGKTYSGHCKEINFYESNNYSFAFGKATVYTNSSGNIVGFYDEYDFNPQKWGNRSVMNEIKTRMVNGASKLNGIKSSMRINYGYSRWNP